jgi:2-polyprenyl-3-methyl-5-hydroxy-6-metoxy-1,4-benzoquinol methylase
MKKKLMVDEKNKHLGGNFENGDPNTYSEAVWQHLLDVTGAKKILDLGSGRGFTSKWFIDKGIDVISVDGLEQNVLSAIVPTQLHDITAGPYLSPVDLVICVEVVEHIEEVFLENLLSSLGNGTYIFMTHAVPGQNGYHHVNCQESKYWVTHLKRKKYSLMIEESIKLRELAKNDSAKWLMQNGSLFKNDF